MTLLTDSSLLKTASYINGQWVNAERTMPVLNPATGETIANVASVGLEATDSAIAAAAQAFSIWRTMATAERAKLLRSWFNLIIDHQQDLARLITLEEGKPLTEAQTEVTYGASFIEWFAEEGRRIYGDVAATDQPGQHAITIKQPIGVVAAITPWNFPIAMVTRKVAPALAAGCTVVLKPAPDTPLSALALAELAQRVGIPAGVFNVVVGEDAQTIGKAMTSHPLVRKLSFTGSTKVGKQLLRQCAGTVKKISMELGGNAPFIVFDDADLDAAVAGAIASKFRNSGQTCVCANRFLVHDTVFDAFANKLCTAAQALQIGNGLEEGVGIGPLINIAGFVKVDRLVKQALSAGARLLLGGSRADCGKLFYQPTVLVDVDKRMDIYHEEIFGPVATLFRFATEEEAIAMANDTCAGLASYCYTRDSGRMWRVGEQLDYGMVGMNVGSISSVITPFGGFKESGIGREGSKYGIEEYLEIKHLRFG
jgi:succinate-semialdehyde dehydrogenase/glutarate-semialdehyde dehydrogenase